MHAQARSSSSRAGAVVAAVLLAVTVAGCSSSTSSEAPIPTTSVSVTDNRFTPSANRVAAGSTVRWTWGGTASHNVTFDNATLTDSPTQVNGTFEQAFNQAGEFTYYCTVHGRSVMSGRVVVQ